MSASNPTVRTTMFKVPNKDDFPFMVDAYKKMSSEAKKDGKPYILSYFSGPAPDDPRNDGYNYMTTSLYATKEDMDYYDNECQAHAALKASFKGKIAGPPKTVYFQTAASSSPT